MLQRQIEQKILNHNGSPIMALNIASARAFSVHWKIYIEINRKFAGYGSYNERLGPWIYRENDWVGH